jgi:hypothetical protein
MERCSASPALIGNGTPKVTALCDPRFDAAF